MTIVLNGEERTIDSATISELVIELGYENKIIAVASNEVFVARRDYKDTEIQDGDDIEIVAPMQGG
jgi:sulfur carrier protein